MTKVEKFKKELMGTFKEVFFTVCMLLKIIVPVSIVVKILSHFGIIEIIGRFLGPVMRAVGLPGESGLIWATAMATNIYGGLIVFFSMAGEIPFTMAQVTVLSTMILVAHSMPVELRIAHAAGVMSAAKIGTHDRKTLIALEPDYLMESIAELTQLIDFTT